MLPQREIRQAVEIQKRSYKLLRWLGEAIDRGFVSFSNAHGYSSASDSAYDWIEEHLLNIPEQARPPEGQLRPFSNYFGSYVTTSFDLVEEPVGHTTRSCGCCCQFCSYLGNHSHLKVKRPTKRDKDKAVEKCIARLQMLAQEEDLRIDRSFASVLVGSERYRRDSAYSAYGLSLLERVRGSEGGVHLLALWRMIAWKPEGSPIKNFLLESKDIFDAEDSLVSEMTRRIDKGE